MLSMYITNLMPKDLSSSTAGLRTFVNILVAVHNLKEGHRNQNDSAFTLKRRWWNCFTIGTIKKASFESTLIIQSSIWRRDFAVWRVFKLRFSISPASPARYESPPVAGPDSPIKSGGCLTWLT